MCGVQLRAYRFRLAVPLRLRPLRRDQLSPFGWGLGGLRKSAMDSDSRKAQRNSFAHHRAELLFSFEHAFAGDAPQGPSEPGVESVATRAEARRQRVRAGLLGFVPMSAAPAF